MSDDLAKVEVDAHALYLVLTALLGPPHLIRELQATYHLSHLLAPDHPIRTLVDQYNQDRAKCIKPNI